MIVGLGIDIVSIERMRRAEVRFGERFVRRILGPAEFPAYTQAANDSATHLAARFAVKEAALKALSVPEAARWHEIIVQKAPSGQPTVRFEGSCLLASQARLVERVLVTISHDGGIAAAVVVLESKGAP
jgi:holo-[acyl-carrier protein] synthase